MSTLEKLSEIANQLPEKYREALLEYAENMYLDYTHPDDAAEKRKREEAIKELVLERYIDYKKSGQKGRSATEVIHELRDKYSV